MNDDTIIYYRALVVCIYMYALKNTKFPIWTSEPKFNICNLDILAVLSAFSISEGIIYILFLYGGNNAKILKIQLYILLYANIEKVFWAVIYWGFID